MTRSIRAATFHRESMGHDPRPLLARTTGHPVKVSSKDTARPTSPPPDAKRYAETAEPRHLQSTVPPSGSGLSLLTDEFVMPERRFFDRLEERARRAELLTVMLQAQGLSAESGVCALQAALGAIVTSAEETHLTSLAALARALQNAIGELGIQTTREAPSRRLDVLVLDETEISRDLVALAVEAQGHMVRCASSYEDFIRHLDERLPDLLVTDVELSNAPPRQFCENLAELLATRPVPLVFFSGVDHNGLQVLARQSGARAAIAKEKGVSGLMVELERVFRSL
jgi:CheY-like chemotaxis protein